MSFSTESHYLGALFLQRISSAVEDSHMLIRGAEALVTIALKGTQGQRGIQTRERVETHV